MDLKNIMKSSAKATILDEAIELPKIKCKIIQTDKKLPDKAIDLIDLACSRFNFERR